MTRNLTADTLVEATTEELVTYLQSGALNTRALAKSLDYEGLDIADWSRIKRIHFCLATEVHEFISVLPDRVRRIKTENQQEHIQTHGEVRGAIEWGSTLRTWADTGYADRSRFVCDTPYTEYDIPENRVLKRLLWHIHRTVTREFRDTEYEWRRNYWTDDRLTRFSRLYNQNVHLNRIANGQDISVTGQDLNTARQSRLSLYTDAYDLYDKYQRLQSDTFDPDITELLAETLVVPAATPRLFELFCLFRLIRLFDQHTSGFQLQPIDGDSNALARLETADQRIDVYHDSTGSLHFGESLERNRKPAHPTFKRYYDALFDYTDALGALTGTDHDPSLYNGRPDIIIEVYDTTPATDTLVSVLIGEVKESGNEQTFRQGLEELLMYRRFADHDGYLVDDTDISVTSVLITNGFATTGMSDTVVHLNGHDLLSDIKTGLLETDERESFSEVQL